MAARSYRRYAWMLLFVVPCVFLWFGIDSAFHRYEMRAPAVPITATVADIAVESYSCEDSDGTTRTCRRVAYALDIDMGGGRTIRRPLLDGNFDPSDTWHSLDMVAPADHPVGSPMAVLIRPDLDHAVAVDGFFAAYVLPIVLIAFGVFWFVAAWFLVPVLVRDG